MRIAGLQKLSLLDFPGHVSCTVFTGGCNFRCPFCHNASLVLPEQLADEPDREREVLAFLKKRQGILEGVVVSGGEPLLQADIRSFLEQVRSLGYQVKLDTNGSFPEKLKELVEAGLVDRVAMDIKNAPALYRMTAGAPGLDLAKIEESRNFLLSGAVDYEFRTTVVKGLHTEQSLLGAAEWIRGAKAWFLQQYKDSGNIIEDHGLSAFSDEEMRSLCKAVQEIIPVATLRGVD